MAGKASAINDIQKIIEILIIIKNKINDKTELVYTYRATADEAIADIENCILKLSAGNISVLQEINMTFAATGQFQEMAMQNGWSEEYLRLADRFDSCYAASL